MKNSFLFIFTLETYNKINFVLEMSFHEYLQFVLAEKLEYFNEELLLWITNRINGHYLIT